MRLLDPSHVDRNPSGSSHASPRPDRVVDGRVRFLEASRTVQPESRILGMYSQSPQQGETRTLCCCGLCCVGHGTWMDREDGPRATAPWQKCNNHNIVFNKSKSQAPQPEPERPSLDFGSGGSHACPFDPGRRPCTRYFASPPSTSESQEGADRGCVQGLDAALL